MNVLNHRIDPALTSGALRSFVLVIVGALLLAAVVALSMPSGDAAWPASSGDAAAPAVPAVGGAAPDTGVPDAASVLGGPGDAPEEAPATF